MNNTQFNIKKQQRIQAMHDEQCKQEKLRTDRLGEDITRARTNILELEAMIEFSQKNFDVYRQHHGALYKIYWEKYQLLMLAISRLQDKHPEVLSIYTMIKQRELEALNSHPVQQIIKQHRDRLGLVHLEDKLVANETLAKKIEENKTDLVHIKDYLNLLHSILEKIISHADNVVFVLSSDGYPIQAQRDIRRLLTSICAENTVGDAHSDNIF